MFITVVGNNGTHGALHRAGRKFANGVKHRIEVVPNLRNVQKVRNGKNELVPTELPPNPHMPLDRHGQPSMEQICEAGFKLLETDPRISITKGTDETVSQTSLAISALREQLADAQSALSDARISLAERDDSKGKLVELQSKLDSVTSDLEKTKKQLADAQSELAAAAASAKAKAKDAESDGAEPGKKTKKD